MKELIFIITVLFTPCDSIVQDQYGIVTDKKELAARRFHGISAWYEEPDGRLYFERDGQTCKLYTNAFKKKWGK